MLRLGGPCFPLLLLLCSVAGSQGLDVDPALPSYRPRAGVVGVIRGHGSAAKIRLMSAWQARFQGIYPRVRLELDDAGLESAEGGPETFGPRLGHLREGWRRRFKERFGRDKPAEVRVCYYALEVYVHKNGPPRSGVSIRDLERVFSSRFKDLTWGDLGCGGDWAVRAIAAYAPLGLDAEVTASNCLPEGLFWFKQSVRLRASGSEVIEAIANDEGALGIAPPGCETDEVRPAGIIPQGAFRPVAATPENVWSGAYPLTSCFYLLLDYDSSGQDALDLLRSEFLRYILSREGQQEVVRAGYVPLSAEIAKATLAQIQLTPTGDGTWDRMVRRLRARRVPSGALQRIERLTQAAGDRPSDEQLVGLSVALARTRHASAVTFVTDEDGAEIKYRLVGAPEASTTALPTPGAKATLPIGLYNVWTERDGTATSPPDAWFEVVQEQERIKIYEARTDFRGVTARYLRFTRDMLSDPLSEGDASCGWTEEAQQQMVKWCDQLLSRIEAKEPIECDQVLRDLRHDFESLGITGGELRDMCIELVMDMQTRQHEKDG